MTASAGILERDETDPEEARRVAGAVLVQPAVVRPAIDVHRSGSGTNPQAGRRRVQHRDVDAVGVHVDEPRERIPAPGDGLQRGRTGALHRERIVGSGAGSRHRLEVGADALHDLDHEVRWQRELLLHVSVGVDHRVRHVALGTAFASFRFNRHFVTSNELRTPFISNANIRSACAGPSGACFGRERNRADEPKEIVDLRVGAHLACRLRRVRAAPSHSHASLRTATGDRVARRAS